MSDVQRYPCNFNVIKYLADNLFSLLKVFIFVNLSSISYKQEIHVNLTENPQMKINNLNKTYLSDTAFEVTIVYRPLLSSHREYASHVDKYLKVITFCEQP